MRLDGLDVLASNVEEMKGLNEAKRDLLDTSGLNAEDSGSKIRREETSSASLKTAMSQQRVNANAAYMLTLQDKRPANATPCAVDMDVDAAEELSVTKKTRK